MLSRIISRLKDLGYKEKDMEFGCSIKKWTGVKRAKALTERGTCAALLGNLFIPTVFFRVARVET